MKKSLLTECALIRKTCLVRLQMIVHRVLVFLSNIAVRTYVESIRVFCVDIRHGSDSGGGPHGFNFCCAGSKSVHRSQSRWLLYLHYPLATISVRLSRIV